MESHQNGDDIGHLHCEGVVFVGTILLPLSAVYECT